MAQVTNYPMNSTLFATLALDLRDLSHEERSRAATVLSTVAAEIEKGEHWDVKTLLLRVVREP